MSINSLAKRGRSKAASLLLTAAGVTVVIVAAMVVPIWVNVLIPRWFVRGLTVGLLWAVLAAFLFTLVMAPAGAVAALVTARRSRRLGRPWQGAARVFLLCVSCLTGAAFLETGAAGWKAWSSRLRVLPTRFVEVPKSAPAIPTEFAKSGTGGALRIVVIGESSARGEPYHPHVSVGQIVGWQLERVLGRPVQVDVRAAGGLKLELAVEKLEGLDVRPDAILLYCGHNEFQSTFGWHREVSRYLKEEPYRAPYDRFLDAAARRSALCDWVRAMREKQRLDLTPPRKITRNLVDVPVYTPEEYAFLRTDFGRRLEQVVRYCEAIGALPLLVIPAGNDSDYEPNRSVMSADSRAADRESFTRDVLSARALESTDPAAAERAFRALVARQPGFAEVHFRLAKLLERDGRWAEARTHATMARDLDGLPVRCPSDFQRAYHDVAARHDVVLVDGPAVLSAVSPRHGLVGDELVHDAQHPNLLGYISLAREMLSRLHARRDFGWPEGRETPVVGVAETIAHFGLGTKAWVDVCERSGLYYNWTAFFRYDPSDRKEHERLYDLAARRIAAGGSVRDTGLTSLEFLGRKPSPVNVGFTRPGSTGCEAPPH